MRAEAEQWLSESLAETLRVHEHKSMVDWCEENLIISRRQMTPFPGPFRTEPVSPWGRGWFDALEDPETHTVIIKKGAQVSATQIAYCAMCYWITEDPDPVLMVMPTEPTAKSASKLRIIPLMEDSPIVRDTFTDRKDDLTTLEYKTRLTAVRLVGANSPVPITMFPHRYLILDELDKIKETLGKEGSTIGLIFSRTKQFWNRKRLLMSTPTTKAGSIERYFLLGDQRMYFVACPKCGFWQVLKWAQVKFDSKLDPDEAAEKAYYECENRKCKSHLTDADKEEMVQHGEWRATAKPKRKGYVSFWLSGLYSLSDECSFGALTAKFLTVKDEPSDLQQFINEDLGELWEQRPAKPFHREQVYEIKKLKQFKRGHIPTDKKCFVALIVDVQATHIVWGVLAFRPHDIFWIDHGTGSVLEELPAIAAGPYIDAEENEHACRVQMLDSGYRTTEVYKYHLRTPRTIVIKGDTGQGTKQTMPIRYQQLDRFPDGKKVPGGAGIQLRHVHPTYFKEELVAAMAPPGDKKELKTLQVKMWFHEEIDSDFVDQITGEIPIEEKPNKYGDRKITWKRIRANHFFDIGQYAMAFRWMIRRDLSRLDRQENKPEKPSKDSSNPSRKRQKRKVTYGPGADDDR